METKYYRSKIDWWFWILLLIIASLFCLIGSILEGKWIPGTLELCLVLFIVTLLGYLFSTVKYAIRGNEIGIRGLTYKWEWFPIDKIESIKLIKSILASSALSFDRIAINFSDRKVLKSSMPLEISPKDREEFLNTLKSINPSILIEE